MLTLVCLVQNLADDKCDIFITFLKNKVWYFMYIVSIEYES